MKPLNRILALARGQRAVADTGNQARLHKAVCSSVVRTLHRLGMSGRVEVKPFAPPGRPPALFITVERAVVKVSQAAMSMLSREIVAHAQRKYATEIEGVYWRIEVDFDAQDDLEGDVFGPTTIGYLVVEETTHLHRQVDAQASQLEQAIHQVNADIATSLDISGQADGLARQVRDSIERRRLERAGP